MDEARRLSCRRDRSKGTSQISTFLSVDNGEPVVGCAKLDNYEQKFVLLESSARPRLSSVLPTATKKLARELLCFFGPP